MRLFGLGRARTGFSPSESGFEGLGYSPAFWRDEPFTPGLFDGRSPASLLRGRLRCSWRASFALPKSSSVALGLDTSNLTSRSSSACSDVCHHQCHSGDGYRRQLPLRTPLSNRLAAAAGESRGSTSKRARRSTHNFGLASIATTRSPRERSAAVSCPVLAPMSNTKLVSVNASMFG
jgi:hypothetical protein